MARARPAKIVPRSGLTVQRLPRGAVLLSYDLAGPPSTHLALSPACARVVELAVQGLSDREIAHQLGRSHYTVSNQLRRAYRTYGVYGRHELAVVLAKMRPTRRRSA